jgi:hypothetical protein
LYEGAVDSVLQSHTAVLYEVYDMFSSDGVGIATYAPSQRTMSPTQWLQALKLGGDDMVVCALSAALCPVVAAVLW